MFDKVRTFYTEIFLFFVSPSLANRMMKIALYTRLASFYYKMQLKFIRKAFFLTSNKSEIDKINQPAHLFFVISEIDKLWKLSGFYAESETVYEEEKAKIPGTVFLISSLDDLRLKIIENYLGRMSQRYYANELAKRGGHWVH